MNRHQDGHHLTVHVEPSMAQWLRRHARAHGVSQSEVVRRLLQQYRDTVEGRDMTQ